MSEPPATRYRHHGLAASNWILIGLGGATIYICWPLWPALVMAAWTVALVRPVVARFERALGSRRWAAVAVCSLLFLGLALPLSSVTLGVVVGGHDLAQLLARQASVQVALQAIASGPDSSGLQLPGDLAGTLALVARHGAELVQLLGNVAGAAAGALLALCMYFGGVYVFLLQGGELWAWMKRNSPLLPGHLERFGAAFQETGHGLLAGVGLTTATQGGVATLVYLSLGVPRWWVLGPITGLASIIPIFGSTLIWGPIAAGLFLGGHAVKGSVLLVLGTLVISMADNLLQPIYARIGALKMPTYLLFVTLFGGLLAFGAWGALLGPLIVRLWLEAMTLQSEVNATRAARRSRA